MAEKRPILIVIAGPNGSGKTTFINEALQHGWTYGCEHISPDNIAQEKFGDWNSPSAVLKAAKLAEEMRENCLQNRKSVLFETVFSTQDKIDYIKRAKEAGFFIRLFFIGTAHPDINVRRVSQRVLEKGHNVPTNKIHSRYYKSINNLVAGLQLADRGYVYDNSVDDQREKLIVRTKDGDLEKLYVEQMPEWVENAITDLSKLDSFTFDDFEDFGRSG